MIEYPLAAIVDTIFMEGEGIANFGPTRNQAEDLTKKLLEGPLKDPRVIIELAERART